MGFLRVWRAFVLASKAARRAANIVAHFGDYGSISSLIRTRPAVFDAPEAA